MAAQCSFVCYTPNTEWQCIPSIRSWHTEWSISEMQTCLWNGSHRGQQSGNCGITAIAMSHGRVIAKVSP